MSEEIAFKVTTDDKDIKKAITYYILRIGYLWIWYVTFALLMVSTILYRMFFEYDGYNTALLLVVIIVCSIVHFYYYTNPVNKYVEYYNKRGCTEYIFTNDRVKNTTKYGESIANWKVFVSAFNIPSAIILVDQNGFLHILPKRFIKEQDVSMFEELIAQNISKYVVKK